MAVVALVQVDLPISNAKSALNLVMLQLFVTIAMINIINQILPYLYMIL